MLVFVLLLQLLDIDNGLHSALNRHIQVHENDIVNITGLRFELLLDFVDGLLAIFRRVHQLNVVELVEHGSQTNQVDRFIIHNQDGESAQLVFEALW